MRNSQCPYLVRNVTFRTPEDLTFNWQYPDLRSILENTATLLTDQGDHQSLARDTHPSLPQRLTPSSRCKALTTSFLLHNRTRVPQGEILSLIKSLSSNSCNCIFNSCSSISVIWYGALEITALPGRTSIPNSISRFGSKLGRSSGKTSLQAPSTL